MHDLSVHHPGEGLHRNAITTVTKLSSVRARSHGELAFYRCYSLTLATLGEVVRVA